MNKIKTIGQLLENNETDSIIQKRKSPITAILFITGGLMLYFLYGNYQWPETGILSPTLLISATVLMLTGIVLFFYKNKVYIHVHSGKQLKNRQVSIDIHHKNKLMEIFREQKWEQISELKGAVNDTLLIQLYYTSNCEYCIAQLVLFQNLQYEAINEAVVIPAGVAQSILSVRS